MRSAARPPVSRCSTAPVTRRTAWRRRRCSIKDAGHYRIWVRYSSHPKWRGPFQRHRARQAGANWAAGCSMRRSRARARATRRRGGPSRPICREGEVTLQLSKHENKNAGGLGAARRLPAAHDGRQAGAEPPALRRADVRARDASARATTQPVYIHIFADHFHAPWYQHYSLGRTRRGARASPSKKPDLLKSGEQTAVVQHHADDLPGLRRDAAHHRAPHATPNTRSGCARRSSSPPRRTRSRSCARSKLDNQPGGVAVFLPPNLLTAGEPRAAQDRPRDRRGDRQARRRASVAHARQAAGAVSRSSSRASASTASSRRATRR